MIQPPQVFLFGEKAHCPDMSRRAYSHALDYSSCFLTCRGEGQKELSPHDHHFSLAASPPG